MSVYFWRRLQVLAVASSVFFAAVLSGNSSVYAQIEASILPLTRITSVNRPVVITALIYNASSVEKTSCRVGNPRRFFGRFSFIAVDADGSAVAPMNGAVSIPARSSQMFKLVLTPTAVMSPRTLSFGFTCTGAVAPLKAYVNILQFEARRVPVADVVALASTISGDGIFTIVGKGASGVSTFSVTAYAERVARLVRVRPRMTPPSVPVSLYICETNRVTGRCLTGWRTSVISRLKRGVPTWNVSTFAVRAVTNANIPLSVTNRRVLVDITLPTGQVLSRVSVAVQTRDLVTADTNRDGIWDNVATEITQLLPAANLQQAAKDIVAIDQNRLVLGSMNDVNSALAQRTVRQMECAAYKVGTSQPVAQLAELALMTYGRDRLRTYLEINRRLAGSIFVNRTQSQLASDC